MTMSADKALRCVSCGAEFVFTIREQDFHASKGFTNEPRRCPSCRQARRASPGHESAPVGPQREQRATPPGERVARAAGAVQGAATAQDQRRTFAATGSACGVEAILSFEPVGNRPVLCSTCYD